MKIEYLFQMKFFYSSLLLNKLKLQKYLLKKFSVGNVIDNRSISNMSTSAKNYSSICSKNNLESIVESRNFTR